ncbi:radical SAM (seleno)protein TrsS [Desulfogranum japonicum]|uniref:radical SAM (seleno)protein TrsS n=1 Tax=Desulfogranum japonicum TaxID=231447 RepID=UPI000409531E|nr:radical SAM (seleno)protein TrsS [Desulfogranum japonicum]
MNQQVQSVLSTTKSLCPVCFAQLPATRHREGDAIYLVKSCPEHGTFRTVIWRDAPVFENWQRPKIPSTPQKAFTQRDKGCPLDCGLCSNHKQHTCTALLEITKRCNLHCPVCFADTSQTDGPLDPDLETIEFWYDRVLEASGPCNIQISGGEPTVRKDLPDIIALGKRKGFPFLQLNTNGLQLAADPSYAMELKQAGLSSVFLQFDGTNEEVHRVLRGRNLCDIKEKAVHHCAQAELGIVLVPTLVPGVNIHEINAIVDFGVRNAPAVRGVHFQPVSYFGRYPTPPADRDRLTLPEVLAQLERQSNGRIQASWFAPPACEHALCSFHASFLIDEENRLRPLSSGQSACCSTSEQSPISAREGRQKSISFTARQWSHPLPMAKPPGAATPLDDLDRFLLRAKTHTFSISAMAFQDIWNLDLERVQGCCIHIVSPEGNLVPFCAYNITSSQGIALYR